MDLAARFSELPPARLDEVFDSALHRVVATLRFDRGTLYEITDTDKTLRSTQSWAQPGVARFPTAIDIGARLPFTSQCLLRGEVFAFSRPEELPVNRWRDRETYQHIGQRSMIAIPLQVSGRLLGALSLAVVKSERTWSPDWIRRVHLVAALFAGALERKRAERALHDVSERLVKAQDGERRRIAREIHAELSQHLAMLQIDIELLHKETDNAADGLKARVEEVLSRTNEIATRVRSLSSELHPSRVQRVGLIDSLERLCQDITKRHGIQVTFQPGRLPDSIPKEVELCLFRVAQEALGNVVKHSGAFHTSVVLHQTSDGLRLYIADDGVGFDTRGLSEKTCIGMLSMCERLNQSHGKFDVESSPGGGTRITAVIPEGDDEAL